jgi:hypothetical protein
VTLLAIAVARIHRERSVGSFVERIGSRSILLIFGRTGAF